MRTDDCCRIVWFDKNSWYCRICHFVITADKCVILWKSSSGTIPQHHLLLSIIDDSRVLFQNFFRFLVKVTGHLVDLIFAFAACAAQADFPATTLYFQLLGTFSALHGG